MEEEDGSAKRRVWVAKDWWDAMKRCPDSEYLVDFKMSKSTFHQICESLDSISVRPSRVAVCLWHQAKGESLNDMAKRFSITKSACHNMIVEVCTAICKVLMREFLYWPSAAELVDISTRFEAEFGIPNVIGAVYTTHIPIIAPNANMEAYFNRRHTERNQKTSYSLTVQGVVSPKGVFTNICIGWPGSLSDEKVLENSLLFHRGSKGALSGNCIVGGGSYPLTDWTLVPYINQNLTSPQQAFNQQVSQVREVARKAFEKMKRRWSFMQKRVEMKLDNLLVVLGTFCILHNICEMRGEGLGDGDGVGFQLMDDETVAQNPISSIAAVEARDRIAHV